MTITELFTYIVTPKPPMKLNITTTLYRSLGHCTGASDQQKIELVPLDITPHSFTLLAAMNDTNDTEDIIEHIEVSVICKQEGGENSYERTGHGTQFVFNHLELDTDYNCAGFATPKGFLSTYKISLTSDCDNAQDNYPDPAAGVYPCKYL